MNIDNIPVIGKLNRSLNMIIFNFVLLAVIFIVLALSILFFPKVLEALVAFLLVISAFLFLHIAYNIYNYKKKYTKFLE